MSNVTNMGSTTNAGDAVRYEDVAALKSRVSWGAIIAGAVMALATYLVLTMLFVGLGLTINDVNTLTSDATGWGAALAAVVAIAVAMFVGGYVTTQLTAGETQQEAIIHGVLTWAAVTALTLFLVGMGVRAGFNALMGATYVAERTATAADRSGVLPQNWEEGARKAGFSQERIDEFKKTLPNDAKEAADKAGEKAKDPAVQDQARKGVRDATWWTLIGTLLSVAASVGGALVGAGPTLRLFPTTVVHAQRREVVMTR